MNKTELVSAIAARTAAGKKDTEEFLDVFTDIVAEELAAGCSVKIVGFGTFESVERSARRGRNPQTGETTDLPATHTPKFRPGKKLRDAVKE